MFLCKDLIWLGPVYVRIHYCIVCQERLASTLVFSSLYPGYSTSVPAMSNKAELHDRVCFSLKMTEVKQIFDSSLSRLWRIPLLEEIIEGTKVLGHNKAQHEQRENMKDQAKSGLLWLQAHQ